MTIGIRLAACAVLTALLRADAPDLQPSKALEIRPLSGLFHHVQGIDVEGDTVWVSSVDAKARKGHLYRVSLHTGRIAVQVEVQQGERVHPGGVALYGDDVWVAVAEYRRSGTSAVQRRDKRTLALLSSFEVGDHIGCVAAGPGGIVGGNWDSVDIYFWDLNGRLLRKLGNRAGNRYQDMKWVGNSLVASGKLAGSGEPLGAIDWLDPESLALRRRVTAGPTDRGILLTNEGMALRDGSLYFLPEDDPTRLFIFRPVP